MALTKKNNKSNQEKTVLGYFEILEIWWTKIAFLKYWKKKWQTNKGIDPSFIDDWTMDSHVKQSIERETKFTWSIWGWLMDSIISCVISGQSELRVKWIAMIVNGLSPEKITYDSDVCVHKTGFCYGRKCKFSCFNIATLSIANFNALVTMLAES